MVGQGFAKTPQANQQVHLNPCISRSPSMGNSNAVTVTREFRADFELVVKSYGLTDTEVEEAKAAVRADLDNAIPCYKSIAQQIREIGCPC